MQALRFVFVDMFTEPLRFLLNWLSSMFL